MADDLSEVHRRLNILLIERAPALEESDVALARGFLTALGEFIRLLRPLPGASADRLREEIAITIPGQTPDDQPQGGGFERIVIPAIVVTYAVGIPVWSFGRVLAGSHRPSAAVAAGLAMACSVVLQLWLLVPVAEGRRPRHAGWLIAAFALINAAAFPFIGAAWFAAGEQLAVLAAVYLRPRWSVLTVAALAATPAVVAAAGQDQVLDRYFARNTVFWALTMGVVIWLARTAARLRASREELASSAVIAERVRIDDELGTSLAALAYVPLHWLGLNWISVQLVLLASVPMVLGGWLAAVAMAGVCAYIGVAWFWRMTWAMRVSGMAVTDELGGA